MNHDKYLQEERDYFRCEKDLYIIEEIEYQKRMVKEENELAWLFDELPLSICCLDDIYTVFCSNERAQRRHGVFNQSSVIFFRCYSPGPPCHNVWQLKIKSNYYYYYEYNGIWMCMRKKDARFIDMFIKRFGLEYLLSYYNKYGRFDVLKKSRKPSRSYVLLNEFLKQLSSEYQFKAKQSKTTYIRPVISVEEYLSQNFIADTDFCKELNDDIRNSITSDLIPPDGTIVEICRGYGSMRLYHSFSTAYSAALKDIPFRRVGSDISTLEAKCKKMAHLADCVIDSKRIDLGKRRTYKWPIESIAPEGVIVQLWSEKDYISRIFIPFTQIREIAERISSIKDIYYKWWKYSGLYMLESQHQDYLFISEGAKRYIQTASS